MPTDPYVLGQVLYRVVDAAVYRGEFDLSGEWMGRRYSHANVRCEEWTVTRVTSAGAWIQRYPGGHVQDPPKWVRLVSRFAQRTKESAVQRAIAKRAYHVKMLRKRLKIAERRLHQLQQIAIGGE